MTDPLRAPNALAALILRRLQKLGEESGESGPLSVRKAAEVNAQGQISDAHLGNLIRGRTDPLKIQEDTARGIAAAIKVDLDEVYEAAGVPPPKARWVLPARFDRVPEAKRRIVEDLIAALLDSYEQGVRKAPWR